MSPERHRILDESIDPIFTEDEVKHGWHICHPQCALIVGPEMEKEWEFCLNNGCEFRKTFNLINP